MLNLDQSPAELDDLYGTRDYYWYLRSDPFRQAFLEPLARIVNRLGAAVLDVGCGEAVLADYAAVPYTGLDGSQSAIDRAYRRLMRLGTLSRLSNGFVQLHVGRFEDPVASVRGNFGTVVFGGILDVLVRPEARLALLEHYRQLYGVRYFVIYDLVRLDTAPLDRHYHLVELHTATAELDRIEEVKKHRKICVYATEGT